MDAAADKGSDFARAVELVCTIRASIPPPRTMLDGHIVEIRDTSDSTCIDKMQLQRFTETQSIICDRGSEFTIQYSAACLPAREPLAPHTPSKLVRKPGGNGLITHGLTGTNYRLDAQERQKVGNGCWSKETTITTGRATYSAQEYADCRLLPGNCIWFQNMTPELR